jgi:hypothetical protein
MATRKRKATIKPPKERSEVVHLRFRETMLRHIDTAAAAYGIERPDFIRLACTQVIRTGLVFSKPTRTPKPEELGGATSSTSE